MREMRESLFVRVPIVATGRRIVLASRIIAGVNHITPLASPSLRVKRSMSVVIFVKKPLIRGLAMNDTGTRSMQEVPCT